MNHLLKNFDWSLKSVAKILGVFVLGVVALGIVAGIISFAFRTIVSPFTANYGIGGGGGYYAEEMAMDSASSYSAKTLSLSSRNIVPPIPGPDGEIVDATAEDYEVKSYSANYQPRDKTEICAAVANLKADPEIVFSSSNESDRSCYFTFEVPNERAEEILKILKDLDPEDLNANIYTIQKSVEGTSDQLAILTQKLEQTEATLADAQEAYEDLMKLATNSRDVENLTQLIRLKIEAIEQLAQSKISINQQIEQVQRNRADLLRQIANTTFNVSVYEQKFVDWQQISDNWKNAIREFVSDLTDLTQFVTVRLVSFVLYAAAGIVYLGIVFGFLKVLWILGKKVWKYKKN
ncbi:MAG: DUF4349 domain-containing protein [Candidatus Peribacteraceae bacterium]|nr:DUF4349 domain-containing protein [Candidatus Peribacteraceae bacterium]